MHTDEQCLKFSPLLDEPEGISGEGSSAQLARMQDLRSYRRFLQRVTHSYRIDRNRLHSASQSQARTSLLHLPDWVHVRIQG